MPPNTDLHVLRADDEELFVERSDTPIFTGGVVKARSAGPIAESIIRMAGSAVQTSVVRFEAGSHTKWHTHTGDQILVITQGRGHVGTEKSDHLAQAGDIIIIPAGVVHYHGASETDSMSHLTTLFGDQTTVLDMPLEWPPNEGPA